MEDDIAFQLAAALRQVAETSARTAQIVAEHAIVLDALLQILRARGDLGEGHLAWLERLREHAHLAATPAIELDTTVDKYTIEGADIDCASRMHLCHGRCCSFTIKLSRQDLVEGKLAWQLDQPYLLAKTPLGHCTNMDPDTGGCGAYAHRPAVCRTYDCREDARVWLDFEQRIPAPMPDGLIPLRLAPKPT
jgi:Fe-S-cluster containining protein